MEKDERKLIISIIIVIISIALIIYFLVRPRPQDTNKIIRDEVKTTNKNITTNKKTNKNMTQDTNTQNSQVAKNGDTLIMNYTGRLTDGTVFDSNVDPKFNHVEPFKFTLGAGQVIKGWDEGLLGMKIGEKKTLTISPEKGYGDRAVSSIPANSTLIFDVELVGIE